MDIIVENPYRVLGVFAGASLKEIVKNKSLLDRYAEIGKIKNLKTDFNFLSDIQRNDALLREASNKIGQAKSKVIYALFWFVNFSSIDEMALSYLTSGDIEKAEECWLKLVQDRPISERNYSAYLNLATLYIEIGISQKKKTSLYKGIELKTAFITSVYLNEFIHKIAGDNVILDINLIANDFCSELNSFIDKSSLDIPFSKLLKTLNGLPQNIIDKLKQQKTSVPLQKIEDEINFSIDKRKDASNAFRSGMNLYNSSSKHISYIENLLGSSSLQLRSIRNSVANEILESSICYFNYWLEEGEDKVENSLELARISKVIKPSGAVLERINDSIQTLEDRIEEANRDRVERAKFAKIEEDLKILIEAIEKLNITNPTIGNINIFILTSSRILLKLKEEMERSEYLNFSSVVANKIMEAVVVMVNKAQSTFESNQNIDTLFSKVNNTMKFIEKLRSLDMDSQTTSRYNENKSALDGIFSQVQTLKSNEDQRISRERELASQRKRRREIERAREEESARERASSQSASRAQNSNSSSSGSSGGCYIATMAYGDYNHPQVMELRRFRDDVLAQSFLGRAFIRFYYATSPHLVKILNGHDLINKRIRNVLDKFIDKLN